MTVVVNTSNPRTLDQSFCMLKESCITIDEGHVRDFLFDFASRVEEHEEIDRSNPKNRGFLEFVMRSYWSVVSNYILSESIRSKHPEKLGFCFYNLDAEVDDFLAAPENKYIHYIFQRAKESGEFAPVEELSEAF